MPSLAKLLKYDKDSDRALFEEVAQLNEQIARLGPFYDFDPNKLSYLKGEKGDDGKTPERGTDYFTDGDVRDFVAKVIGNFKEIKDQVTPVKGRDYFDGKDGKNGANGKNADVSAETIAKRLNSLVGAIDPKVMKQTSVEAVFEQYAALPREKKISWSKMFREDGNPFAYQQVSGAGLNSPVGTANGGTGITSYAKGDTLYASADNVLSKLPIGTAGQVYSVSAGGVPEWKAASGGITILTATGAVDDSNTAFTFAEKPDIIFINGMGYRDGSTIGGVPVWTWAVLTATLSNPVGTGGDIYGIT